MLTHHPVGIGVKDKVETLDFKVTEGALSLDREPHPGKNNPFDTLYTKETTFVLHSHPRSNLSIYMPGRNVSVLGRAQGQPST